MVLRNCKQFVNYHVDYLLNTSSLADQLMCKGLYLMSYENACLRLGSYDPLNYIDRFEQAGVEKFDLINLSTAIANKRRVTQLLTMVLSERICWSATGRRGYYWLPHDIQKEDGSKLALPVLGFRIERSETRSSLLVRGQWCSLALVKQSESFGT
ncbi:hypothetical protein Tco_0988354 [Tanacetum coccineum]|uniref:Uncharacterized protein n=1 Tax=Tanacetum coccineum TaxID=301880 RepID=A0ABQ5EQW8_9ASTR